jgi:hypothetical protein
LVSKIELEGILHLPKMTSAQTNEFTTSFIIQKIRASGHLADVIKGEIGVPAQVIKIAVELISNNPFKILTLFYPFETFFCKDEILFVYSNGFENIKVALYATRNRPLIQFYLSYGEIGHVISKICRSIGLKFNRYGLAINLLPETKDQIKKEFNEGFLILSCNPNKICDFLGLDFATWTNGFTSNNDIFKWIMSSKYYDSGIFMKLKSHNSKRKKLNSFTNQFLDYIEMETTTHHLNVQTQALAFFGIS